jgi:sulfopyruvate decarboxylase TPP-binding subunit
MPVSVAHSRVVYDALKACDVRIISALPETWLVHLIRMAEEDPEMRLVCLAKEEEGIGILARAHLAGVNSASGARNYRFLAAINPLVSLALLYKIPLLMLISYRGHFGERDPWQIQGGLGDRADFARAEYFHPACLSQSLLYVCMHGADRFGLTSLINLDQLPPAGALVMAAPLKIVGGSGCFLRVLAIAP